MGKSFLALIEQSIKQNWDVDALSDIEGSTLKYKDVAKGIAELHIFFDKAGVKAGDKIALCGKNSSNWGVIFLATLTYGAVCVPILSDFKADNIHNIVNHSDSIVLFVDESIWENLDEGSMQKLKAVLQISDYAVLVDRLSTLHTLRNNMEDLFIRKFVEFNPDVISYHVDAPDELAYISYTSGTTSFSKGVMIPYRSLWSNIRFAQDNMPIKQGDNHVCMLPMAHAFGLLFSFLFEFANGCHTYFLSRPNPKIIFKAYKELRPTLIITVPLVIEKIVRKNIFPVFSGAKMTLLMLIPALRRFAYQKIREKLFQLFGGNFIELVIGGAALSPDVEDFLKKINFPFTVGYGMTECGPLISYASSTTFKAHSCGHPVDRLKVKIVSDDVEHAPGEVLVKGDNVTLGYYKGDMDNAKSFDADGWFHTGDIAIMDKEKNIYLKGRCKTMLLGSNGQNIYPEEIEDQLNHLPYVVESLVVQRDGKLVALVHPNYNEGVVNGLSIEQVNKLVEDSRVVLNKKLPHYSQIANFQIYPEEFDKTPKRSIKRFLYN
ncbi:MAG: AMP-binding protein [Phocaeicola sp.]|uniref:AMP-binding protein n=1 Tax=Phocaeicola sp. TaxID=2773926 RepID=UPI003F9FCBE8